MAKQVKLQALGAVSNGALKSDKLPSRIKILDWGVNKTLDGEVTFDEQSAQVFYANQKNIGRTFAPLDFNHNTVPGTVAYENDKEPRAVAGYGVPTVYHGDGLYYEYMCWTPSGDKSAKDYADISPAVITDASNRVIALHSTGLTPAGAVEGLSFYSADSIDALKTVAKIRPFSSDEEGEDEDEDGKKPKSKKGKGKMKVLSSDMEYADPERKQFPICTEEHVRAAWRLFSPGNVSGYSSDQISGIKETIAAKAKQYGIELKAESADDAKVQVNAYVTDPYKGLDMEIGEMLEFFRAKLGLPNDAKPDDIMKAIRAKWEGIDGADKQVLPFKTEGGSVNPQIRNDGPMDGNGSSLRTVITYDAIEALIRKNNESVTSAITSSLQAKFDESVKAFNTEIATLKAERDQKAKDAEGKERQALLDEATRKGAVLPLSAENLGKLEISLLREMVANAKPEVPVTPRPLKALSADGKVPAVAPGAKERASAMMTDYFAQHGVRSRGRLDFTGVTTPGRAN